MAKPRAKKRTTMKRTRFVSVEEVIQALPREMLQLPPQAEDNHSNLLAYRDYLATVSEVVEQIRAAGLSDPDDPITTTRVVDRAGTGFRQWVERG